MKIFDSSKHLMLYQKMISSHQFNLYMDLATFESLLSIYQVLTCVNNTELMSKITACLQWTISLTHTRWAR